MSSPDIAVWLQAADVLLGRPEPNEDEVDDLVQAGLDLEVPNAPAHIDPVQLERVLAVLRARRSAMAGELAELARRRVELTRAQAGVTGYLNSGAVVPMH